MSRVSFQHGHECRLALNSPIYRQFLRPRSQRFHGARIAPQGGFRMVNCPLVTSAFDGPVFDRLQIGHPLGYRRVKQLVRRVVVRAGQRRPIAGGAWPSVPRDSWRARFWAQRDFGCGAAARGQAILGRRRLLGPAAGESHGADARDERRTRAMAEHPIQSRNYSAPCAWPTIFACGTWIVWRLLAARHKAHVRLTHGPRRSTRRDPLVGCPRG